MAHHHGGFRPFDDPQRRQWQDPDLILTGIGLGSGMCFADIGCGGGFFSLPAARMVEEKGKIFGVDANPDAISMLQEQAEKEGLKNIFLTTGSAEDTIPCQHCADFVFFGIALHDFNDPEKVLRNARKIIKKDGKLIDLDWKKQAAFGPPSHIRFSEEKASGLIEKAGFKVSSVADSGLYHYLITAALK
jgi:ubiquinone/menaquinone biosynthesis C-methylase UbiE